MFLVWGLICFWIPVFFVFVFIIIGYNKIVLRSSPGLGLLFPAFMLYPSANRLPRFQFRYKFVRVLFYFISLQICNSYLE